MKIALTGAHRVGKTTLAEQLQESLPQYVFRQEPYAELEENGYFFSETPHLDDFLAQLEHSITQLSTDERDVIFDRCPLDLLAYIHAVAGPDAANRLYYRVEAAMAAIDLLVFVPVEQPDPIGCPESGFPVLREDVNELLQEWIGAIDSETICVTGTLAEREAQVLRKLAAFE